MPGDAPYMDPSTSIPERISDLLDRMNLREKAGQLTATIAADAADIEASIEHRLIGAAAPFGHSGSPYVTAVEAADVANRLQRFSIDRHRLGVPLLFFVDAVHGHARIEGSTVFPHNLGLAATRDPDLVEHVGQITRMEVGATGAHITHDPVCDVARDPRWGRTFETFGESATMCARLASAKVEGYLDPTADIPAVLPTAKHFPAYSEPQRGQDGAPLDISEDTLSRSFLPPFRAAIDAGVPLVMPGYNSLNGEPIHGSRRYLTGLLRAKLGFDGIVISDWGGIQMLHHDHRTARSETDAILQAFRAGIDLSSAGGEAYAAALVDFVEAGEIDETEIDRRVGRILRTKFRLGLFEDPFVDPDEADAELLTESADREAHRAARESMTLLKNDGILPLDEHSTVVVTGPSADRLDHHLGGWTVSSYPRSFGATVVEAIREIASAVTYVDGGGIEVRGNVDAAAEAAASADVAIAVLGEGPYIHEFRRPEGAGRELHTPSAAEGTVQSFPSRTTLSLPNVQRELVEAMVATGTPTIGILITGRPLAIDWMDELLPAILLAYYPGIRGGSAIGDVLFGRYNPAGKLPISMPRARGNLPERFDYVRHPTTAGSDMQPTSYDPLYPFGHGLSYTSFEYRDLTVSSTTVDAGAVVAARVTVANVGDRAGVEAVDLFGTVDYASRAVPNRYHVGFGRVDLEPDETGTVEITVDTNIFAIPQNGDLVIETGAYELHAGQQSTVFEIR